MIPLALALSFLGLLAFAAFLLHLQAKRPLPLHESVERAVQHAKQAMDTAQLTQMNTESDIEKLRKDLAEQYAAALDTLVVKHNAALAQHREDLNKAVTRCDDVTATVRREMDALAAATHLVRAGSPFTGRPQVVPPMPSAAEVLK
jgi:hypothetical protein